MESGEGREGDEPQASLTRHSSVDKADTETSSITSGETTESNRDSDIIELACIYGGPTYKVHFRLPDGKPNDNALSEVVDNIRYVCQRFSEASAVVVQHCKAQHFDLENYQHETFERVRELAKRFNKGVQISANLWRGQTRPEAEKWASEVTPHFLLVHICGIAFNRAIPSPNVLNTHYLPFSSQVYGETHVDQMQLMLNHLKLTENDVFVDLGSGVGHLVCYVAAATKVKKAVGIEIADVPAHGARIMEEEFKTLMKWHGKKIRPFSLEHGNFLDEKYRSLICEEATVIFINNFAFDPDLNEAIKRLLICEMKHDTRIITTRAYAGVDRAGKILNERAARTGDVQAILDAFEMPTVPQPASWTHNGVPFTLHKVNLVKLHQHYEQGNGDDNSRKSSSKSSNRWRPARSPAPARSRRVTVTAGRNHSKNRARSAVVHKSPVSVLNSTVSATRRSVVMPSSRKERERGPARPISRPHDDRKGGSVMVLRQRQPVKPVVDVDNNNVVKKVNAWKPANTKKRRAYIASSSCEESGAENVSSSRESSASKLGIEQHKDALKSKAGTPCSISSGIKEEQIKEEYGEDVDAYGMTTRRKWNEYVLNTPRAVKRAKASSSHYEQVVWNHEDTDYQPPKRGRPCKDGTPKPRGRPKKSSVTSVTGVDPTRSRLSLDVQESVDILEQCTSEVLSRQSVAEMKLPAAMPDGAVILDPSMPLDCMLIQWRNRFNEMLAHVASQEFHQQLMEQIQVETARQMELHEQVRGRAAAVDGQLAAGVTLLRQRLAELEMSDVETPSELLSRSKQIVVNHKEVTQKCSLLEAEVASLEGRIRTAVPYGDRLVDKLDCLPLSGFDPSVPDPYGALITQTCIESGCPISTRYDSELEAQNEGITSPGSAPRRQRQRARVNTAKRGAANQKPEETSEEMERQIQEIVQKALKVENAVKEKERRARGTETAKRSTKGSGAVGVSMVSGISSSSDVLPGGVSSESVAVPLPRSAPFSVPPSSMAAGSSPLSQTHRKEETSTTASPLSG